MAHFTLLLALTLSSPTLSAGTASDIGQCVHGPEGSWRGRGEDSSALLQGRVLVDDGEEENGTNVVHDAVGDMAASDSSWGWVKKMPKVVDYARRKVTKVVKATKALKEEATKVYDIVKTVAPVVKTMANGTFKAMANFSDYCKEDREKACACAKLDKWKNCQKMEKRECNGYEKKTALACWGFIETCAFIWTARDRGRAEATERVACAAQCRKMFAVEAAQYLMACASSIEATSSRIAKDIVSNLKRNRKRKQASDEAADDEASDEVASDEASKSESEKAADEELEEESEERSLSEAEVADFVESEEVSKSMDETLTTKKTCR